MVYRLSYYCYLYIALGIGEQQTGSLRYRERLKPGANINYNRLF